MRRKASSFDFNIEKGARVKGKRSCDERFNKFEKKRKRKKEKTLQLRVITNNMNMNQTNLLGLHVRHETD
jgi:hypothetical protein